MAELNEILRNVMCCGDLKTIRGLEGRAANVYFSVFNEFILNTDPDFRFDNRNRRPPRDRVNALLSFLYALA